MLERGSIGRLVALLLLALAAGLAGPARAAAHEHGVATRGHAAEGRADRSSLVAAAVAPVALGALPGRCAPGCAERCAVGCASMLCSAGLPAEPPALPVVAATRGRGPSVARLAVSGARAGPWRPPPDGPPD